MSAWIVSKAHIDALVTAASDMMRGSSFIENMTLDDLGTMLWSENHKSVNARYSESTPCPEYKFKRRAIPLSPVEVLKAISCFEYQSCEHKGWKSSKAKEFFDDLRHEVIGRLPGYNAAPWGIND